MLHKMDGWPMMESGFMESCEKYIYSEEYVSYILPYYGDLQQIQDEYQPDCLLEIGGGLVVLFQKGNYEEGPFGYGIIPKCYGLLDTSNIESTGVGRVRRQPYLALRGSGVLVGILDTGIEYTHPAFLNDDGTTRIAAIWDQTASQEEGVPNVQEDQQEVIQEIPKENGLGTGGGMWESNHLGEMEESSRLQPYFFGTEYSRQEINEALKSDDPYRIVPQRDENGHGTAMAGIIAGNEMREQDFSGVAPLSTLVVVKLKQARKHLKDFFRIPDGVECFDETDLLFGIYYLLRKAIELDMPMVIYLGVGTNQGSHIGNTSLNKYINYFSLLKEVNFVGAAGNETNLGHHTYYSFGEREAYKEVELQVEEEQQSGFSMEIWVNSASLFSVEILSPGGEFTGKIPVNQENCHISNLVLERVRLCTSYHAAESYSPRMLILVRFFNIVPGTWRIRIYNDRMGQGNFHIWLPMQGFINENTRFLAPVPETVICDPGNGEVVLTIGAYNHRTGGIYLYSSRGYTAEGMIKPDLVSAGVDITAPDIMGGFTTVTGTSVAAAHVAGISALLWEWSVVEGFLPKTRGGDIKRLLIMGAERNNFLYPNREFGYGIANIYGAFDIIRGSLT